MPVVTADLSTPSCTFRTFREQYSLFALLSIPFTSLARIALQSWLDPYLLLNAEPVQLRVAVTVLSQAEIHLCNVFLEGERIEDVNEGGWLRYLFSAVLHTRMSFGFGRERFTYDKRFCLHCQEKKRRMGFHLFKENTVDLHGNSSEVLRNSSCCGFDRATCALFTRSVCSSFVICKTEGFWQD